MLNEASIAERLRQHARSVDQGWAANDPIHDLLPQDHQELLAKLNGFTLCDGAVRVFGLGRNDSLDLRLWNDRDGWRGAWDDRIDAFLSFGSTAWGDQFAYRYREAGTSIEDPVYFLECTLLRAEVVASSFSEFAESELVRVAEDGPYDSLTVAALERFGHISADEMWAYAPPLALGGIESVDSIVVLPAVQAMTVAGDIATALRRSTPGSRPTGVHPWVDESGRQRLRIDFDA